MSDETHCPLCNALCIYPRARLRGATRNPVEVRAFHEDINRIYLRCACCALVFVPREFHLDRDREKAEYDCHENDVDDPGYRAFLSRLATPLIARLPQAATGLDFGCGPAPALAAMLREAGHTVALYDPFYAPERTVLSQRYQFICATEVVEHLRAPGQELAQLWSQLLPGGWLAIMTKLVRDQQAFAAWHYIRDPTHISFFSRDTWAWWAHTRCAQLEIIGADVILLRKPCEKGVASMRAVR